MANRGRQCDDFDSPVLARWAREEIEKRSLSLAEIATKTGLSVRSLKRRLSVGQRGRGNFKSWGIGFMASLSTALGHQSFHLSAVLEGYKLKERELRE